MTCVAGMAGVASHAWNTWQAWQAQLIRSLGATRTNHNHFSNYASLVLLYHYASLVLLYRYVLIFPTTMDLRKPKISADFENGEVLESFKAGPFPSNEDVLRHLYFHLRSMTRPNADEACVKTANSLLLHWAPSYLPLMARQSVKKKVAKLYW